MMADINLTDGRPKGDSQSHEFEIRPPTYSFVTGGTVTPVPGQGNVDDLTATYNGAAAGEYVSDSGGGATGMGAGPARPGASSYNNTTPFSDTETMPSIPGDGGPGLRGQRTQAMDYR
jgi:hypothetical protein